MKRSTTPWTTALAAAALLALPVSGWAQTSPPSQPPTTQPPTTQPPPAPPPTTPPPATQPPTTPPPTTPPPTTTPAQVDAEAARRRLTEARDTLNQLTQLPAAAQLSGEARTQVSQLITNFNELITTPTDWRATYAKVDANLTMLLGPDNTDAERTGVSTGTAGTTGTAGATGSTGTTAGLTTLDPAIRAKLVELRRQLNEFAKGSGGVPTTAAPKTEEMGHQEAMRHIQAIEGLLGTGTAAPLTLTAAQVEQLRTHLAELRKLVSQAEKR